MINKANLFISPNKIIFGNGTADLVGKEAEQFGAKKALIITDKGVMKANLLAGVQDSLKAQKIDFHILDEVEAEPSACNVDDGAKLAINIGADIIIGVGGGSSMDVAKGIAVMVKNKGKILDYAGADLVLCMTSGHVQTARALAWPDEGDKVMRLDPDADIKDPIGMDQAAYDALAGRLMQIIPRRLKELKERIRR